MEQTAFNLSLQASEGEESEEYMEKLKQKMVE